MAENLFKKAAEPMPEEPMPEEGMEEGMEEGADENHPAYQDAILLVKSKLYEEGAGEKLMQALASAPDPVSGIADQTVMLFELTDQMTEQAVPDELVVPLLVDLAEEVIKIAQAGGMQVDGRTIAAAMKKVIVDVITSMGGDTTDVQAAMGQIPEDQMGAALDGVMGSEG